MQNVSMNYFEQYVHILLRVQVFQTSVSQILISVILISTQHYIKKPFELGYEANTIQFIIITELSKINIRFHFYIL